MTSFTGDGRVCPPSEGSGQPAGTETSQDARRGQRRELTTRNRGWCGFALWSGGRRADQRGGRRGREAVRRIRHIQQVACIFRERTVRPPERAVSVPGRRRLPHGSPGAAGLTSRPTCESPDVWLRLRVSEAALRGLGSGLRCCVSNELPGHADGT